MNVKNNFFIINPLFYYSATVIFFISISLFHKPPITIPCPAVPERRIRIKPQRRPDQIPHQQRRRDHQRAHHQSQTALHDRNLRDVQSQWKYYLVGLLHKNFQTASNLKKAV